MESEPVEGKDETATQERAKETSAGGESLKVYIRVRPRLKNEFLKETAAFVDPSGKEVKIVNGERIFEGQYDQVFSSNATQRDVYSAVEDYIQTVITGINSTIFAYGQTGSGKTHTMFGPNWEESLRTNIASSYQRMSLPDSSFYVEQAEKHGIIPRTIYKLFADLFEGKSQSLSDFTIYCSFMQIYNEKLYDLLQDKESKHPLLVRENKYSGIYVQGLTEYVVTNMDDCLTLLFRGERNRITRQTRLNMFSSRSHTVFQLLLENTKVDAHGKLKRAKLNLCDLAGSEKIGAEANLTGKHFEELKNINLSLTTLGKVISALSNRSYHVPYRDSKLTRILQDSIGGNTRTCLIATVAPTADCADETISTLSFANRAKKVKITAVANEISASDDALVKKLQQELQHLKDLLQLKRKGGMSDVHRQLLLLRQENEKLRAIHTDWEQIERLKMENKMMRLELQRAKEVGSTANDTDTYSNLPPGDTPMAAGQVQWKSGIDNFQRKPTRNTPQSVASEDHNPRGSEQSFLTTMSAAEISKRIEQQRKFERERAVDSLRRTMSKMGRCPVCTLPIPCKHYKSQEELKVAEERSASVQPKGEIMSETTSTINRYGSGVDVLSTKQYSQGPSPYITGKLPYPQRDMGLGNVVFNNSPDTFKFVLPTQSRFSYQSPAQPKINPFTGSSLKDAALRSLHRRADIGIRASAPHSRLAADGPFSAMLSTGQTQIRMKGRDNRYEPYKGPSYQSLMQKTPSQQMRRTHLRDSNDRLRALQELDRRREEQLKKEFEALEIRRKQQEEETQRRINIKKVRLAETGYLGGNGARFMAPLNPFIKERQERDLNQQQRFVTLSKRFEQVRDKYISRESFKLGMNGKKPTTEKISRSSSINKFISQQNM